MQMRTGVKLRISFTIIILLRVLSLLSKQRIIGSHHYSYDVLVLGQDWVDTPILSFVLHLEHFPALLSLILHIVGHGHKTALSTGPWVIKVLKPFQWEYEVTEDVSYASK